LHYLYSSLPASIAKSEPQDSRTVTHVIDLSEYDPYVVQSYLSILYTGNYDDPLYGASKLPNAIALQPVNDAELRLRHPYNSYAKFIDVNDNKAAQKVSCGKTERFHRLLVQSLLLGLTIYVISDKYQVPSAQLLALERVYRNMAYIIDEDCGDCDGSCLPEGVATAFDYVYSNTAPDATSQRAVRQSLSNMIKEHVSKVQGTSKLLNALENVVRKHEDFASDVGRNVERIKRMIGE
jgi:hypothetical protein